ncbi:MAG: hypothetical protein JRN09_00340 [Nitrososphaerota archaeon]|nr:hypothetical protein [Nitrososphaerota archaeon]
MSPNRTRSYLIGASALVGLLLIVAAGLAGVPATAAPNQRFGPPSFPSNALTPTAPAFGTFGGQSVIKITYTNNLNASATFVVYGVFHNSLGQVVYMTTASITILVAGNQTAYLVTSLVPQGNYRVTIFATTTQGIVASPVSSIDIQAS